MKKIIYGVLILLFLMSGCNLQKIDNDSMIIYSNITDINNDNIFIESISIYPDDGIRAVFWHYNYGNKEWKYFTILNATCHQVTCDCVDWGCMAYCLECEPFTKE